MNSARSDLESNPHPVRDPLNRRISCGMSLYHRLLNPRTRTAFELGQSPWQNPFEEFATTGPFAQIRQFRRGDIADTRGDFIEMYTMAMKEEWFPDDWWDEAFVHEVAGKIWDWMDDGVFWIGNDQTFDDVGPELRFRVTASRYRNALLHENPPGPLPDHADGTFEQMLLEELRKHV